jgi:hypothetical protein
MVTPENELQTRALSGRNEISIIGVGHLHRAKPIDLRDRA